MIESRAGNSTLLVRIALLLAAWCVVVLFSVSQLVATYTASGNPAYWGTTFRFTVLQWIPWLAEYVERNYRPEPKKRIRPPSFKGAKRDGA